MLQINEDLEKLKKLTHVSKVTLELRLYLKETALEGTLMQMNQEGISDFTNYVGKKADRESNQKSH